MRVDLVNFWLMSCAILSSTTGCEIAPPGAWPTVPFKAGAELSNGQFIALVELCERDGGIPDWLEADNWQDLIRSNFSSSPTGKPMAECTDKTLASKLKQIKGQSRENFWSTERPVLFDSPLVFAYKLSGPAGSKPFQRGYLASAGASKPPSKTAGRAGGRDVTAIRQTNTTIKKQSAIINTHAAVVSQNEETIGDLQRTVTANNTIIDEQAATIADLLEKNRKLAQNSWKATSRAKAKVAAAIPSATEMKKEHHAMAAIRRLQSLSSQTIAQQQEHISELQGLIVIDAQVNEELRAKLMAAELSCAQLTGQLSEVEARVKAAEAALTQRVSSAERNFTDKFKEASGTYTKEIRQVYYELLWHHASTAHATDMVVSVLSIFGGMDRDQLKKRLPSHKTVRRFLLEMGELANIQLGDCLCRLPMAGLNHDGTTLGLAQS